MQLRHPIAATPKVAVPIRVRGMSHAQRFFDVQTETTRLAEEFIVVGLPDLVDLDTELHVTNLRNEVGGIFRATWVKQNRQGDVYPAGLELLDPEGEMWEPGSIPAPAELDGVQPEVRLECSRCHGRQDVSLPEADPDSLGEGFTIRRHCDTCKATTTWAFTATKPPEAAAPAATAAATPTPAPEEKKGDQRLKGRAPIKLLVKVVRKKSGSTVSDVGETINISRTGVYFASQQHYEVGEMVEVIVPYHPDSVAIPVRAHVVRLDQKQGDYQKRVAIRLTSGTNS